MKSQAEGYCQRTRVVRWAARIWSLASIGMVALFMAGEGFNPVRLSPTEALGFLFFPLGISLGMVVAWWKEGLGGSITVGSLMVFYVIHLARAGVIPRGWAWLAFAAPGFLFLFTWFRSRKRITVTD